MEFFVVIISWLLFGGASSYFASQRGRDPLAWFMIGMLLGILGLLLLFLLPPLEKGEKQPAPEDAESLPPPESLPGRLNQWFYLDKNRLQVGPLPFHQLKKDWDDGAIKLDTLVWSEGMGEWKQVAELPSLRELLGS